MMSSNGGGGRTKVMLGESEIADIVTNRQMKNALTLLSKKYGVSTERIRGIWKEYFGGTTLADAAKGPIKPLGSIARAASFSVANAAPAEGRNKNAASEGGGAAAGDHDQEKGRKVCG